MRNMARIALNDFWDEFDYLWNHADKNSALKISRNENEDLIMKIDVAGLKNINIEIDKNILIIKGETEDKSFRESLELRYQIDTYYNIEDLTNEVRNGVLTIIIPKNQKSTKKIEVVYK